jgi:hypothetical protein
MASPERFAVLVLSQFLYELTSAFGAPGLQLASGEVYGKDQPIALQLLGSERSKEALEGVAMELEDSLYPLLREVGNLRSMME